MMTLFEMKITKLLVGILIAVYEGVIPILFVCALMYQNGCIRAFNLNFKANSYFLHVGTDLKRNTSTQAKC